VECGIFKRARRISSRTHDSEDMVKW
jgi:hypothetical protein